MKKSEIQIGEEYAFRRYSHTDARRVKVIELNGKLDVRRARSFGSGTRVVTEKGIIVECLDERKDYDGRIIDRVGERFVVDNGRYLISTWSEHVLDEKLSKLLSQARVKRTQADNRLDEALVKAFEKLSGDDELSYTRSVRYSTLAEVLRNASQEQILTYVGEVGEAEARHEAANEVIDAELKAEKAKIGIVSEEDDEDAEVITVESAFEPEDIPGGVDLG